MTDRVAPSRASRQSGVRVAQLGSARTVIEAMGPAGGVFITSGILKMREADTIIAELGFPRPHFKLVTATAGPDMLYRIPPEATIGVDVDAFAGVIAEMWAEMQRILTRRFTRVIWG